MSGDMPLGATEAAKLLGVHRNTLLKIPATEIPFFRVGSGRRADRRYFPADIEAYIQRHAEGTLAR